METTDDHEHPASAPSETTNQSKPSDQESEQIGETDDRESSSTNRKTISTVRSYECSFCKKGFTNAQALGGHMNIHRKDRNKNKKPFTAEKAQQLFQIPHIITTNSSNNSVYFSSSTKGIGTSTSTEILNSGGLKRAATWPNFASSRGVKFPKGEGDLLNKISSKPVDHQEDKEVDLELRLGFKSSSAANDIKTRSFF